MPNGGNWDRFWFTLIGFHMAHGRWPTSITLPEVVADAVSFHLTNDDLAQVRSKLLLKRGNALLAEDDTGANYEYCGPPEGSDRPDPQAWLGVAW